MRPFAERADSEEPISASTFGNDGRQAGDERLRERLFSLEDLFDPGGDACRVLDRSGEPFAEVRDTNPELLKEIAHSKFPLKQI